MFLFSKQAIGSTPIEQTDNQAASCSSQCNELVEKVVKLEKEKGVLIKSLTNVNSRLGVEIISDSESSVESLHDSEDAIELPNTRNFQIDPEFANRYFFITNVMGKGMSPNSLFLIIEQYDFSRRAAVIIWTGKLN